MTTAARLQDLADREDIRQIFTDYARFLDGRDYEGYAGLFARNGYMKASLGEARGPAEILALLNKYREPPRNPAPPRNSQHVVNNHDIRIAGDTATADVLWFYLVDKGGSPTIQLVGRYQDELVREDGIWKLARHDIAHLMGRDPFGAKSDQPGGSLEQRLQAVEDREAITRLCIELSNCLDARDLAGYGARFTEDGEWSGIVGRAVGPVEIETLLAKFCKPWESESHRTYHMTHDLVIDLDGDTAKAMSKWQHIVRGEKDEPVTWHLGTYDDRFRRTPEGWRFTRRAAYAAIPYVAPKYQLIGLETDAAVEP